MTGNDLAKFIEGQLALTDRWVSGSADLGELHISSIVILAWLGILMFVLTGTFIWLMWNERDTHPHPQPGTSNPEHDRVSIQIIGGIKSLLRGVAFLLTYFLGIAILFGAYYLAIAELAGMINQELKLVVFVASGIPMLYVAFRLCGLLERIIFRNPL